MYSQGKQQLLKEQAKAKADAELLAKLKENPQSAIEKLVVDYTKALQESVAAMKLAGADAVYLQKADADLTEIRLVLNQIWQAIVNNQAKESKALDLVIAELSR